MAAVLFVKWLLVCKVLVCTAHTIALAYTRNLTATLLCKDILIARPFKSACQSTARDDASSMHCYNVKQHAKMQYMYALSLCRSSLRTDRILLHSLGPAPHSLYHCKQQVQTLHLLKYSTIMNLCVNSTMKIF
jgi:hypothetical protein